MSRITLEQLEASLKTDLTEIRLSDFEYIHDLPKFIDGHLSMLKAHSGEKRFLPYWERLVNLAELINP